MSGALLGEHSAFNVFEPVVRERLSALGHFPQPSEFRALTQGILSSMPPWFEFAVQDDARLAAAGGFDALIAHSAAIPTRPELHHDLLGALIWLHFPALKSALHRVQLAGNVRLRSASQNAATHLDESGVLVVSTDLRVFAALRELRWRELFWERRAELLESTRFIAFGHGWLDALRAPHPKLMGKALCARVQPEHLRLNASALRVFLDRELARRVPAFLRDPARLMPLPVLGVPAWHDAQSAEFYRNESYFRTARSRSGTTPPEAWLELSEEDA